MKKRYSVLLLGAISLGGCWDYGLLFPGGKKESGKAELKQFASGDEFVRYFRNEVVRRNDEFIGFGRGMLEGGDSLMGSPDGGLDGGATGEAPQPESPGGDAGQSPAPGDKGNEEPEHSGTTIQEEGVDEADVVKTDGSYLYIIDQSHDRSILRIVRVDPPEELAETGHVELDGSGSDLYLLGDTVVALTETHGGFLLDGPGEIIEGGDVVEGGDSGEPSPAMPFLYERPKTFVSIIDVSDRNEPVVISATSFVGNNISSRMIDGVLHLVVANYPEHYFDVLPLGTKEVETIDVVAAVLLPDFEVVDEDGAVITGDMVGWRNVYHPVDEDGFGMVTVISMDVQNEGQFSSVGIVATPGLVYASTEALYLTDTEWNIWGDTRETTDVYKFAFTEEGAVLAAVGQVPGRILNQYSMSEYEGVLRVATTTGPWFGIMERNEPANHVFVLAENNGALEVIGSIDDIAAGEEIQSARFVGSRGFLVTFEQIDPLFTLDLSDPSDPRVVGELKVPGFSTFIVPMGADHLLTVGQYIPEGELFRRGVQLSIFDVSDFANPQLDHLEVVGDGEASSEALWDPKAFTYFAERGLLALPATIYGSVIEEPLEEPLEEPRGGDDGGEEPGGDDGGEEPGSGDDGGEEPGGDGRIPSPPLDFFEGLMVYRVSAEEGFVELGRIDTQVEDDRCYNWFTRGVFIGDLVFAVTNNVVRGAPVDDISSVPHSLEIGER